MCAHDRLQSSASNKSVCRLSSKELALHNTPASAYVAIRGKVYNLTEFLDKHPGGRDVLCMSIGRDVTQVFETYHDVAKVEAVLR